MIVRYDERSSSPIGPWRIECSSRELAQISWCLQAMQRAEPSDTRRRLLDDIEVGMPPAIPGMPDVDEPADPRHGWYR